MRRSLIATALSGSILLAGCTTFGGGGGGNQAGAELLGRSAQMVSANGQTSVLHFDGGGNVRAAFNGREARGNWYVGGRRLCFIWGGNEATRECWPYASPFRRGQTRAITSDRGNVVRVTLL